jgi:hypothetical protein
VLTPSSDAARIVQGLVGSGASQADEVWNKFRTMGCDWEKVVVVHMDEVSRLKVLGRNATAADPAMYLGTGRA